MTTTEQKLDTCCPDCLREIATERSEVRIGKCLKHYKHGFRYIDNDNPQAAIEDCAAHASARVKEEGGKREEFLRGVLFGFSVGKNNLHPNEGGEIAGLLNEKDAKIQRLRQLLTSHQNALLGVLGDISRGEEFSSDRMRQMNLAAHYFEKHYDALYLDKAPAIPEI